MVFFKALNGFLMPLALQRTVSFTIFLFTFLHSAKLTHCTGQRNIFKWAKSRFGFIPTKAWAANLHWGLGRAGVNLMVQRVPDPRQTQNPISFRGCCCSEGWLRWGCCRGTGTAANPNYFCWKIRVFPWTKSIFKSKPRGGKSEIPTWRVPKFPLSEEGEKFLLGYSREKREIPA